MWDPKSSELLRPLRRPVKHAVWRARNRSSDLERGARRHANLTSAAYIAESMPMATPFRTPVAVLRHALSLAPPDGLVAEFGVYSGATLREIAKSRPGAHGFDSFEGLPEDWRDAHRTGSWAAGTIPDITGVELHVGWFSDTVPPFARANTEKSAFLHLDADLYSSTDTVLRELEDTIVPGTVLLFDEYFNYPGWTHHEHRALLELVERTGLGYEYVAYNARGEQVAVLIR